MAVPVARADGGRSAGAFLLPCDLASLAEAAEWGAWCRAGPMELFHLFLAITTAVATGVTAYAVWQQWRGNIQVEWEPAWNDMYEKSISPHLEIVITVRNYQKTGVRAWRVDVSKCPVKDVTCGSREKPKSWQPHQAPLNLDVEPGVSKSCRVIVFPDWAALASRRSVTRRPNSSTPLRVQISLASKASKRTRIERHTTIPIPNERIIKAATIAKA